MVLEYLFYQVLLLLTGIQTDVQFLELIMLLQAYYFYNHSL